MSSRVFDNFCTLLVWSHLNPDPGAVLFRWVEGPLWPWDLFLFFGPVVFSLTIPRCPYIFYWKDIFMSTIIYTSLYYAWFLFSVYKTLRLCALSRNIYCVDLIDFHIISFRVLTYEDAVWFPMIHAINVSNYQSSQVFYG